MQLTSLQPARKPVKHFRITSTVLNSARRLDGLVSPADIARALEIPISVARRLFAKVGCQVRAGSASKREILGCAIRAFITQESTRYNQRCSLGRKGRSEFGPVLRISERTIQATSKLVDDQLYTSRELARLLFLSRGTINKWANDGILPAENHKARSALIDVQALHHYLESEFTAISKKVKTMEEIRKLKVSPAVMRRRLRLLDMEYKVSEVVEELGVSETTVYTRWLEAGMPHRKDASNHIWIHGPSLIKWLEKVVPHKDTDKVIIGENQAFCVGCKCAVDIVGKTRREKMSSNRVRIYGFCPNGHKVVRIKKVTNDQ